MRYILILIIAICTCVVIELVSFFASCWLAKDGVFYVPKKAANYNEYIKQRDALLGWPAPSVFGKENFASDGTRLSPAFSDVNLKPCVSLYGDSFVWADEVDNSQAWGNVLAGLLLCRVANYGVGGYGTDQAYLRFKENHNDTAKQVVLSVLSENILRNVNQYRDLIYPNDGLGFKPRFILQEDGDLELVEIPHFSFESYLAAINDPGLYLPYDYFVPGGASGLQKIRFPYSLGILRAFSHYHIQAKIKGQPRYMDFYRIDHPAQALALTFGILKKFNSTAIERGKEPLVLVLPTAEDLKYRLKQGVWPYQPLLVMLFSAQLRFINVGDSMLDELGEQKICALFSNCSGHLTAKGNILLAELVFKELNLQIGR